MVASSVIYIKNCIIVIVSIWWRCNICDCTQRMAGKYVWNGRKPHWIPTTSSSLSPGMCCVLALSLHLLTPRAVSREKHVTATFAISPSIFWTPDTAWFSSTIEVCTWQPILKLPNHIWCVDYQDLAGFSSEHRVPTARHPPKTSTLSCVSSSMNTPMPCSSGWACQWVCAYAIIAIVWRVAMDW